MTSTTPYKLVVPFYFTAAIAFFAACLALVIQGNIVSLNHAHPSTIGITHIMTLGWGSMMILGAAHQLAPILAGVALYSSLLAKYCYYACVIGLVFIIRGLFVFDTGALTQLGALMFITGVISFVTNLAITMSKSKVGVSFQFKYLLTASIWLLLTCIMGYLQLLNFTYDILTQNSFRYLSVHAHMGFIGWFVLTICGTATKLLPMFMLSKYESSLMVRAIFYGLNIGLISFIIGDLYSETIKRISMILFFLTAITFATYCQRIIKYRIKRHLEPAIKISLAFPIFFTILTFGSLTILLVNTERNINFPVVYGFIILFGMISSIILGMSFKTLPFIVWNHRFGKNPNSGISPANLYNQKIFVYMAISHISGILLFLFGNIFNSDIIIRFSTFCLLGASILLLINYIKLIFLPKNASI